MTVLLVIWTRPSHRVARTHDARTLYAEDAKGGGRSSATSQRRLRVILRHGAAGFGGAACPLTPEIGRRPANYAERHELTLAKATRVLGNAAIVIWGDFHLGLIRCLIL